MSAKHESLHCLLNEKDSNVRPKTFVQDKIRQRRFNFYKNLIKQMGLKFEMSIIVFCEKKY